jgi:exopolysaccharide biosynthesis polyprenyl glycosylphosphotransferase
VTATSTHPSALAPASVTPFVADHRRDESTLQRRLFVTDALALVLAWVASGALETLVTGHSGISTWDVVAATAVGITVLAAARLYVVRVLPLRSVEITRLGWAAVASGIATQTLPGSMAGDGRRATLVLGVVLAFLGLVWTRGCFRLWLSVQRRQHRFQRPVLVVGANGEGAGLVRLLRDHPEVGYEVRGILGDAPLPDDVAATAPWLGTPEDTAEVLAATGASGVVIAATALEPRTLNRMSRALAQRGIQVHVSAGLQGISHTRLQPLPMAHEPIYYLKTGTLARWQQFTKRALDIVAAGTGLVVAAPVLGLAALAIKLQDRGPVFFRQERIGRDGTPFTILKLRTMVPDAERLLGDLRGANERTGPLFKLKTDPRRTRVGRVLEATSLDELPQLFNVLRGTMSLVGPRPPLASEFAQFDDELRHRQTVRPGITGLWQVEARDNPSFHAYRRLDLFYVENWSISLDLAIILATIGAVAMRWWRR